MSDLQAIDAMTADAPPSGALAKLADLAYRRPWRMILAWVGLFAAIAALAPQVAGDFSTEFNSGSSESQRAQDLIEARFPGQSGDTIDVVAQLGEIGSPGANVRLERFLRNAEGLEGISGALPTQVSPDETIALTRLQLDRPALDVPTATGREMIELAESASGPGFRIELGARRSETPRTAAARRPWG
jgi:RND superfamily putative drug exporter